MDLKEKLKEAEGKRQGIVDQVNAIADEIQSLQQRRQALLQEALRFDGEVRTLTTLIKEEEAIKKC